MQCQDCDVDVIVLRFFCDGVSVHCQSCGCDDVIAVRAVVVMMSLCTVRAVVVMMSLLSGLWL